MNKALFWDFDGTLTMHSAPWSTSVHRALELAAPGSGISIEAVRPLLKTGFTWHAPELDYTHLIAPECWWENMRRLFHGVCLALGLDEQTALRASALVRELVLDAGNYTLYEDAVPVLQACVAAGYKNYVVSNNYPELAETAEQLGLSPYFSGYIVSALAGYEKPRREIFEAALEKAGRPEFCCMIGDNPVADIAGAKALGIPGILVHNRADSAAEPVCETLSGVLEILNIH